jgi:hypothetical protein
VKLRYVMLELDTVLGEGETAEQAAETLSQGFDLSASVAAEYGPGGGHPLIRITGPRLEVIKYLAKHGYPVDDYGFDPAEVPHTL